MFDCRQLLNQHALKHTIGQHTVGNLDNNQGEQQPECALLARRRNAQRQVPIPQSRDEPIRPMRKRKDQGIEEWIEYMFGIFDIWGWGIDDPRCPHKLIECLDEDTIRVVSKWSNAERTSMVRLVTRLCNDYGHRAQYQDLQVENLQLSAKREGTNTQFLEEKLQLMMRSNPDTNPKSVETLQRLMEALCARVTNPATKVRMWSQMKLGQFRDDPWKAARYLDVLEEEDRELQVISGSPVAPVQNFSHIGTPMASSSMLPTTSGLPTVHMAATTAEQAAPHVSVSNTTNVPQTAKPAPTPLDAAVAVMQATAKMITQNNKPPQGGSGSNGNKKGEKGNGGKGGGSKSDGEGKGKSGWKRDPNKPVPEHIKCYICGGNHYQTDCPRKGWYTRVEETLKNMGLTDVLATMEKGKNSTDPQNATGEGPSKSN